MSKKIFVIRCKPHGYNKESEFLKGIISVGWPGLGDLTNISKDKLENRFFGLWPESSRLGFSQLNTFINIKPGTLILTPSYESRSIHILKVLSGYSYNSDMDVDEANKGNPHQLKGELLKTVNRDSLPSELQDALRAAKRTVTNFDKYEYLIARILNEESNDSIIKKALDTLEELLTNEKEEIRLEAAKAILNNRR